VSRGECRPLGESGASRARTGDLMPARHALSQLSYGPWVLWQCSRGLEFLSPGHAERLVVSSRRETKPNLRSAGEASDRKEIATLQFGAVRGKCIDLIRGIEPSPNSEAGASARVATDEDDVAVSTGPLALDPHKSFAQEKDHVESAALAYRPIDLDPRAWSPRASQRFRRSHPLIRRQHRQRMVVVRSDD
jgi:hypothetical protein